MLLDLRTVDRSSFVCRRPCVNGNQHSALLSDSQTPWRMCMYDMFWLALQIHGCTHIYLYYYTQAVHNSASYCIMTCLVATEIRTLSSSFHSLRRAIRDDSTWRMHQSGANTEIVSTNWRQHPAKSADVIRNGAVRTTLRTKTCRQPSREYVC